jgi:putative spermidine/putrescine transport system permease protein
MTDTAQASALSEPAARGAAAGPAAAVDEPSGAAVRRREPAAQAVPVARRQTRPLSFWLLAALFSAFVLFLYGPMFAIFVLSFQGPEGGLTFPMRGVSLHWFAELWEGIGTVDIGGAFRRSLALGAVVMGFTVGLSLLAGLAYRKKLPGGNALFYVVVASLVMPSIVVSLGIGLMFRLFDGAVKLGLEAWWPAALENYTTALGMYTSGLGSQLTWTLPFGLLILFAVFNRFNPAYEEAARDLGATPWQSFVHVLLPLIGPSLVGVGMFGFTLSWDEIARSSQAMGDLNTLPLELQGLTTTVTTPVIYALGTVTTVVSFLVMGATLAVLALWRRRRAG